MPVIVIRHGETFENMGGVIQGHRPGRLTEQGRLQVRELSPRLVRYGPFDRIISSDLERARETADLISVELSPCEVLFEKRLRERSYGCLEGERVCRLKRMLVENGTDLRGLRIPGAEEYEDFEARIKNFCCGLFGADPEQKILLITHAGVMRVILEEILGKARREIGNCEGFRISFAASGFAEVHRI